MGGTAPSEDMLALALQVMQRAYAPYSGFPVGAVLRGSNGKLYAGCNIENSTYPEGWCAEVSALSAMVADGERHVIEALVMGTGDALVTPCGGCRQSLLEFSRDTLPIHICDPNGLRRTVTLADLLPLAFGAHNLAGSRRKL